MIEELKEGSLRMCKFCFSKFFICSDDEDLFI